MSAQIEAILLGPGGGVSAQFLAAMQADDVNSCGSVFDNI